MPKNLSSNDVHKILEYLGFELTRQRKETVYTGILGGKKRVAVVPENKKSIPKGTLSSIWRQAGINKTIADDVWEEVK